MKLKNQATVSASKSQNSIKTSLALLTVLVICTVAQSHAATVIANAQEFAVTGGTFTAGTSPTNAWYGSATSQSSNGNPGQYIAAPNFSNSTMAFVTIAAPVAAEDWNLTFDFNALQNFNGNTQVFVIGLNNGDTLSDTDSLTGKTSLYNSGNLGAPVAWVSYSPPAFTVPSGFSAIAIGVRGNSGQVFGLDNVNINVPEPSSLALLGLGAAGLMVCRRRA